MLDVIDLPICQARIKLGLAKVRLLLLHHREVLGCFLPLSLSQIETSQLESGFRIYFAAVCFRIELQSILEIVFFRIPLVSQESFYICLKRASRDSRCFLNQLISRKRKRLIALIQNLVGEF